MVIKRASVAGEAEGSEPRTAPESGASVRGDLPTGASLPLLPLLLFRPPPALPLQLLELADATEAAQGELKFHATRLSAGSPHSISSTLTFYAALTCC